MQPSHPDPHYSAELFELREGVLLMGARVEEMLASSWRAFHTRDSLLAQRTAKSDSQVDRLEVELDERCLRVLARWKPVASDLRFVTAVLKLVTNLERMGDLAESICRRTLELNGQPPVATAVPLVTMAEVASSMVADALEAFSRQDAERAREVIGRDRVVDSCYAQCFPALLTLMAEDATRVPVATALSDVAKSLERIADQATNVAELVVFIVDGRQLKHDTSVRDARVT
jgi:phosphate transport system protein